MTERALAGAFFVTAGRSGHVFRVRIRRRVSVKVTTEPTGVNSFVSERWSSESGATAVLYLRRQLVAAKAVFPELGNYTIYPEAPPKCQK